LPGPARADSSPIADCSGGPINQTVVSGARLDVVVQSSNAQRFGATFNGVTRTGETTWFETSFPTPEVDAAAHLRLVITCSNGAGTVASEYSIIVLPRTGSSAVTVPASQAASAAARARPPLVLKLVLYSIPVLLVLASLLVWRRPSAP